MYIITFVMYITCISCIGGTRQISQKQQHICVFEKGVWSNNWAIHHFICIQRTSTDYWYVHGFPYTKGKNQGTQRFELSRQQQLFMLIQYF